MSEQELKRFFSQIAADKSLQEQLFITNELADVAAIGQKLGFAVTAADILRAQASKILMTPAEELEDIAAGKRGATGAQWGRTGKGYLDNAGYWITMFVQWDCTGPASEFQIESFLAKVKEDKELQQELLKAKTYNDVVHLALKHGYKIHAISLLKYQAIQILKLSTEKAELVAHGEK